jgi:hypothetical protein
MLSENSYAFIGKVWVGLFLAGIALAIITGITAAVASRRQNNQAQSM